MPADLRHLCQWPLDVVTERGVWNYQFIISVKCREMRQLTDNDRNTT